MIRRDGNSSAASEARAVRWPGGGAEGHAEDHPGAVQASSGHSVARLEQPDPVDREQRGQVGTDVGLATLVLDDGCGLVPRRPAWSAARSRNSVSSL